MFLMVVNKMVSNLYDYVKFMLVLWYKGFFDVWVCYFVILMIIFWCIYFESKILILVVDYDILEIRFKSIM